MNKKAGYHIDRSLANSSEDFDMARADGSQRPFKNIRNRRSQDLYGESDDASESEFYQKRRNKASSMTPP